MKRNWSLVWAAVTLFLSNTQQVSACTAQIITSKSTVGFKGCIAESSATILIENISSATEKLIIQSEGGSVPAALRIANHIEKFNLTLFVRGYCRSSCANYLVPAAAVVYIEQGSQLAFHGDAIITIKYMRDQKSELLDGPASINFTQIADQEHIFQSRRPRAARIHNAQSVVLSKKDETLLLAVDDNPTSCNGLGYMQWTPSNTVLSQMSLIDGVVEPIPELQRELPHSANEESTSQVVQNFNPLAHCRPWK